jgi:hypothetical protein
MRADKTYMSTQGKGNLVFKILKNGASDEETEVETTDAPEAATEDSTEEESSEEEK